MILTIISYILIGVVVGFVCAKAYLLAQKRFYATLKHIDVSVGIPDYIIAFLIFLACASDWGVWPITMVFLLFVWLVQSTDPTLK